MKNEFLLYSGVMLFGVFISAVSQVMLKKASQKNYSSALKEYLNPLVIFAYMIFVLATLCSVFAYKVVPLSTGAVIEATSYIYITLFGVFIFKEKPTKKKIFALILILSGILLYTFS